MLVDQQLLEALAKFPSGPIETYAENLDLVRFPSERYQRIFTDYLTGNTPTGRKSGDQLSVYMKRYQAG